MNEINVEERRDRAVAYFLDGYNCAQSVFMAYNDIAKMDLQMAKDIAAPFGAGMGRMREVCGACSAMYMISGFKYPCNDQNNEQEKTAMYTAVQRLSSEFKDNFGSIICADLLKIERFPQDPKPSDRNAKYYAERPCARFVGEAAAIIGRELLE